MNPAAPPFPRVVVIAALMAMAILQWFLRPLTLWEFDEPLFMSAIERYEPLVHHPPPPGYPLFIGVGHLVNAVTHDPFFTLVGLSAVSSVVGFLFLFLTFKNLGGDWRAGLVGAALFYLSPAMLVHSTLPISDPPGLMMLSVTLWLASLCRLAPSTQTMVLFAAFASMTVGMRPQLSIAVLPMFFFVVLFWMRTGRYRFFAVAVFTVASLIWLWPLVSAVGGVEPWLRWEADQASYFAEHDADVSRTGRSAAAILLRFVAHPWGPKFLSFPLLLVAGVGVLALVKSRNRLALLMAALSGPYLVFCLFMMDPADGARYALPSVLGFAFLAAMGLMAIANRVRFRPLSLLVAAGFAAGFGWYVAPLIALRASQPSPPVQAAEFARRSFPPETVILYELPLMPHARRLLDDFRTMPIDKGLAQFVDHVDVPLVLFSDGGTEYRQGTTFQWPFTDAYGKLTRNHYRVVSLIPVPATQRYRPVSGVYPMERNIRGEEWRWLEPDAELILPDLGSGQVQITLAIPPTFPHSRTSVEFIVNGRPWKSSVLLRNVPIDFMIPLDRGENRIRIRSEKVFVPAEVKGSLSRDRRKLAVQVLIIEQRGAARQKIAA